MLIKRSIANSLNQISKKLNNSSLEEFKKIEKDLDKLWQSLNQ
ncbi:plasmid mobilization relaxosome protein MobC [Cetobacterium sp.]